MSEEKKGLVRRFYEEIWKNGNLGIIDELCASDFVDHNPPPPGLAPGLEGAKQVFTMFRRAFPDMQFTVEDQIAEGDKVVSRGTFRGTHKGELMGIPPTGKQGKMTVIDIIRIVDGKMVERWGEMDMLGLMQQLGVAPPT